ncbi:MAG: zinc metallopeptidase, partial [Crocinitomicaceae bacterium]
KRLVLSDQNYHGTSISAIAVAAHECGHALQHQQSYGPLNLRMASVGITSFANGMLTWIMIGGLFLVFYLYFWKKINWIPVITILIYSLGNYGVFWGFSVMDLIFLILLTHHLKLGYEYKK